jgi:CheY-like chemotaxis protein
MMTIMERRFRMLTDGLKTPTPTPTKLRYGAELDGFDESEEFDKLESMLSEPVTLPAAEVVEATDEFDEAVKTEPMVLIVDHSCGVGELLKWTFSQAGYRAELARDGQEAWDKLRSGLPCDIIFSEIEMPHMDGLELLSRIKKDESLKHLPVAILTSRGATRYQQMAADLGASGYLTKPYLEEVLLDAAQRMMKGEVLINISSNA